MRAYNVAQWIGRKAALVAQEPRPDRQLACAEVGEDGVDLQGTAALASCCGGWPVRRAPARAAGALARKRRVAGPARGRSAGMHGAAPAAAAAAGGRTCTASSSPPSWDQAFLGYNFCHCWSLVTTSCSKKKLVTSSVDTVMDGVTMLAPQRPSGLKRFSVPLRQSGRWRRGGWAQTVLASSGNAGRRRKGEAVLVLGAGRSAWPLPPLHKPTTRHTSLVCR